MNTKIIHLIGSPSSGKTTLCSLLFAELKIKNKRVEFVPEFAKTLVWTEDFDTLNNQYYVSKKQFNLLKAVHGKVEYIVTDGSLIHGLYYNRHNPDNICNIEKTEEKILEFLNTFKDNIYIFLKRGSFPYEQEGRIQTENEAKHVETTLLEIMDSLGIKYHVFVSDKENLESILNFIMNY